MKIVFLGTPDFAVASLQALVESSHDVVGVVTMPDKKAGRGRKLTASPVKEFAVQHNIPVLQPTNLKAPEFVEELKALQADLQVVVAFRMLPEVVWNMPALGTINVHASLLPQYRGAAPINWAIINGETETGVTTFQLQHKIDTGNILLQEKLPIGKSDTAGTIHDKLMVLGAQLLIKTVNGIDEKNIEPIPQEDVSIQEEKEAPKIFKSTCYINWSKTNQEIDCFIRGLAPYPAALARLVTNTEETFDLKIYNATCSTEKLAIGEVKQTSSSIWVGCSVGSIEITELQFPGKKRMPTEAFLRGFKNQFVNSISEIEE